MGIKFQEMQETYGIAGKPMMVKNLMANIIIKQVHGTLGNQLHATVFNSDWPDDIIILIQSCAYAL